MLHLPGWKRFHSIIENQGRLIKMENQNNFQVFHQAPNYKYGIEIPKNHNHAMELDKMNGNTLWSDYEVLEIEQIDSFKCFKDLGKGRNIRDGYKCIRVHMVYDIKHDHIQKERLVENGNLTGTPEHSVYSSVVSLRGLRITLFLAELNGLNIWSTDIGNAYLNSYTDEKVVIIAGDEFGEISGHTLRIDRALYGLKSSGLRWWEKFSQVL